MKLGKLVSNLVSASPGSDGFQLVAAAQARVFGEALAIALRVFACAVDVFIPDQIPAPPEAWTRVR